MDYYYGGNWQVYENFKVGGILNFFGGINFKTIMKNKCAISNI